MDPCTFVKISISALALRLPVASKPATSRIQSACALCFCEIKLPNNPTKTIPLPLLLQDSSARDSHRIAATFYLDETAFQRQLAVSLLGRTKTANPCLEVAIYSGKGRNCGIGSDKQLGKFRIGLDVKWMGLSSVEVHNGWVCIGKSKAGELHLDVRAEPDPRFVFQFVGQPEDSPQILQAQGKVHQPIFSCTFSRDRGDRSRSNQQEHGIHAWTSGKEKKDRKGWLILIHDLSGTPVAAASMVTPFVPSHGTDHVSWSNPGAWLILRPGPCGGNSWFPLGRLEAWRECGRKGEISCKFKVMEEGGGFNGIGNTVSLSRTVINCPKGNGDKVNINMELPIPGGFVMSVTTFNGEHDGKGKCSKLEVQLAMRHVACLEDAAVFMALAAAVDLGVDACQPFSRRLTKDLGLSCSFKVPIQLFRYGCRLAVNILVSFILDEDPVIDLNGSTPRPSITV